MVPTRRGRVRRALARSTLRMSEVLQSHLAKAPELAFASTFEDKTNSGEALPRWKRRRAPSVCSLEEEDKREEEAGDDGAASQPAAPEEPPPAAKVPRHREILVEW